MKLNTFKLEEYLGKYEFKAPYVLCCSDAQSWTLKEIVHLADANGQQLWENLYLGYTEVSGLPILRHEISKALYPTLSADNILCFAGAEEGIFCTFFTLCEPEDHVIVITPCYQSLLEVARIKGCSLTTIDLKEENGWRIDIHEIERAIRPNTKWLIINFPHNPTGQIIQKDELVMLINILDKHGIWLFSDEVYRLLGPSDTQWAPNAAEIYPKAISLGVMSKSFGMAGLRIGWIACQDKRVFDTIEKMKHYTSICNSAPAEILSLIALRNKDTILQRNNRIVEENLEILDAFFDHYASLFSWARPKGGCTGFVKYNSNESVDIFAQRLLEKEGVLLLPASVYGVSDNYFRIGFGRKNMSQALEKLKNFLK